MRKAKYVKRTSTKSGIDTSWLDEDNLDDSVQTSRTVK